MCICGRGFNCLRRGNHNPACVHNTLFSCARHDHSQAAHTRAFACSVWTFRIAHRELSARQYVYSCTKHWASATSTPLFFNSQSRARLKSFMLRITAWCHIVSAPYRGLYQFVLNPVACDMCFNVSVASQEPRQMPITHPALVALQGHVLLQDRAAEQHGVHDNVFACETVS